MRREISILLALVVLGVTVWFVWLLAALSVVAGSDLPRWPTIAVIGASIALFVGAWTRLRAFAAAGLVVWMSIVVGWLIIDVDFYTENRKWLVGTLLVAGAAILSVVLIPEPRRLPPTASGPGHSA